MSTHAPEVARHLAAAPGDFDFVQAVDVIEQVQRHAGRSDLVPLGQGSDPRREALAISAAFELSFRSQAIERVDVDSTGRTWMMANFFGLAGPDGPLPDAYADLVRGQLLGQHGSAADFLSMFQHRLLALAYRAEDAFRAAGPFSEPGAGPLAPALLGLLGQLDGDPVRDRMLLANMSLCVQPRHSLHGFLVLFAHQFGVAVTGEEWAGRWIVLPPALHTVLGPQGRNDVLGDGAVLGQRAWNEDGAIRIDAGVVPRGLYLALLPGGARHDELATLCAWYLGPSVACYLWMALAVDDAAPATLADGCLLGHTSWLARAMDGQRSIALLVNGAAA